MLQDIISSSYTTTMDYETSPAGRPEDLKDSSQIPDYAEPAPVDTGRIHGPELPTMKDYGALAKRVIEAEEGSRIDRMTGLLNKEALLQSLTERVALANRNVGLPAFFILDVDKFKKEVNDKHGHDYGDRLIIAVGKVIKMVLREGDVAGRFGGDEFGVVVDLTPKKETGEQTPWEVLEIIEARINSGISDLVTTGEFGHLGEKGVGASYASSVWAKIKDSDRYKTAGEMFHEADQKLLKIKEAKGPSR